jgi:hypothetical protein
MTDQELPTPQKKPWYKKWWIWALIVLGVFVIAAAMSPTSEEDDAASGATTSTTEASESTSTAPDDTTTSTGVTTTQPQTTTSTAPPTTTTTPAEEQPGIGDPVRDGKFEFVVTEIEQPGDSYDPDDVLEDEANGVWLIVHMTVENIGAEAQTFFADNQQMLWNDVKYEASGFTWNGTNIEELNPGIKLDAIVMFDVPETIPEGGVGTVLELHDSAFSGGVLVYL